MDHPHTHHHLLVLQTDLEDLTYLWQGCPLVDLSMDIEPSFAAHTRDSVDLSRVYTSSKSHEEKFRVLESSESQTNNISINQVNEQSLINDSSLHAGFKSSSVN